MADEAQPCTTDKPDRNGISFRVRSIALFDQLGPGLITGAADDDPSGIATYSQAGAQFGYGLLWTMVLTYPLMSAIQLISAHIGRVTGHGLAKNMGDMLWRPLVTVLVALLFIANTINIGADLAAMGSAGELVAGVSGHILTIGFAIGSLLLQMFVPYHRYARVLKWLTLTLFAYVALVFIVQLDWRAIAVGLVWPDLEGKQAIITIVAIFGTTISPYLFFWQCAQEVEDIAQHPGAKPLLTAPAQAETEFRRMRFDTWTGMGISNVVALAIVIGTAATLHAAGRSSIDTAADAARALQPIAGKFAFLLFSLGIIGTGLLAVPVLAGSPIEIEEGWLVLTHGVGKGRTYCMGAALLDRADPSRVLARTPKPLLEPSVGERGGYVPNVVYSCGGLVRGRTLLLPYGVADNYTALGVVDLDDLLQMMS